MRLDCRTRLVWPTFGLCRWPLTTLYCRCRWFFAHPSRAAAAVADESSFFCLQTFDILILCVRTRRHPHRSNRACRVHTRDAHICFTYMHTLRLGRAPQLTHTPAARWSMVSRQVYLLQQLVSARACRPRPRAAKIHPHVCAAAAAVAVVRADVPINCVRQRAFLRALRSVVGL